MKTEKNKIVIYGLAIVCLLLVIGVAVSQWQLQGVNEELTTVNTELSGAKENLDKACWTKICEGKDVDSNEYYTSIVHYYKINGEVANIVDYRLKTKSYLTTSAVREIIDPYVIEQYENSNAFPNNQKIVYVKANYYDVDGTLIYSGSKGTKPDWLLEEQQ